MNHNFVLILLEYPELCQTNWRICHFRTWIILIHDHMINEGKESPVGCYQENAGTSPEKVEGEGTSISSEVNASEKWWRDRQE